MRRFIKKPTIWGINPGWAETIWSMLTHFPGASSVSFLIQPFKPFERHGLRWHVPNMQDMQTGSLCFSLTNFLFSFPFLGRVTIAGRGRWFNLQCKPTISHWSSSKSHGLEICSSCLPVNFGSFAAWCSMDTEIVLISGVSIEDNKLLSTRNSCPFLFLTLCRRTSSKSWSFKRIDRNCNVLPLCLGDLLNHTT